MTQVSNIDTPNSIDTTSVNSDTDYISNLKETAGIQGEYAGLMLSEANKYKDSAYHIFIEIQLKQQETRDYTACLNALRAASAKATQSGENVNINDFVNTSNLSVHQYNICAQALKDAQITNGSLSKIQIDTLIANLEDSQTQIGADIQQQMVYAQDYLSKYNNYLEGANSAIDRYLDLLQRLANF